MSNNLLECKTCHAMLDVDMFTKDPRNTKRQGRRTACKPCMSKYAVEFRKNNEEYRRRQLERCHQKYLENVIKPRIISNPQLVPTVPKFEPGVIPYPHVLTKSEKLYLECARQILV